MGAREVVSRLGQDLLAVVAFREMRQIERADPASGGEAPRRRGGEVAALARHIGVAGKKARLDDERVGAAHRLDQRLGFLDIADHHEGGAGARRAEHRIGVDRASVGQGDGDALGEIAPRRILGNRERGDAPGIEMASRDRREAETETVGVAMADAETGDAEPVLFPDEARRQLVEREGERRTPGPHRIDEVASDEAEGSPSAVNGERALGGLEGERRGEAAETEDMIEIGMGQENPVDAAIAGAAAPELALRALAAIDQHAVAAEGDEERRQPALDRRNAPSSAEKDELEHRPHSPQRPKPRLYTQPARIASPTETLPLAGPCLSTAWQFCASNAGRAMLVLGPKGNPMTETPPDRLSNDPKNAHYDASALDRGVGIRFDGAEKTNVEEYCVSEGWIRVAVGKTVDRRGAPLTIKLRGVVEPYFRTDS